LFAFSFFQSRAIGGGHVTSGTQTYFYSYFYYDYYYYYDNYYYNYYYDYYYDYYNYYSSYYYHPFKGHARCAARAGVVPGCTPRPSQTSCGFSAPARGG
jgi:hypothetical protein